MRKHQTRWTILLSLGCGLLLSACGMGGLGGTSTGLSLQVTLPQGTSCPDTFILRLNLKPKGQESGTTTQYRPCRSSDSPETIRLAGVAPGSYEATLVGKGSAETYWTAKQELTITQGSMADVAPTLLEASKEEGMSMWDQLGQEIPQ